MTLNNTDYCSHTESKYFGQECHAAQNCIKLWPQCADRANNFQPVSMLAATYETETVQAIKQASL